MSIGRPVWVRRLLAVLIPLVMSQTPGTASERLYASIGEYDEVDFNDLKTGMYTTFADVGLSYPYGLAFDANGNLIVASGDGNTLHKFSSSGMDLGVFASAGLNAPRGLVIISSGDVFVANSGNNTIERFDAKGTDLGVFAGANVGITMPRGLACYGGELYVANWGDNTVRRFSLSGVSRGVFASSGLSSPYGLVFDSNGNLHVSSYGNNTVRKFDRNGALIASFSSPRLSGPLGVVIDESNILYVANGNNGLVEKFDLSGNDLGALGGENNLIGATFLTVGPAPPTHIQLGEGSPAIRSNWFGFKAIGASNLVVVFEYSTNLANQSWVPLQTNTFGAQPIQFKDPAWMNNPAGFYRLRTQ